MALSLKSIQIQDPIILPEDRLMNELAIGQRWAHEIHAKTRGDKRFTECWARETRKSIDKAFSSLEV